MDVPLDLRKLLVIFITEVCPRMRHGVAFWDILLSVVTFKGLRILLESGGNRILTKEAGLILVWIIGHIRTSIYRLNFLVTITIDFTLRTSRCVLPKTYRRISDNIPLTLQRRYVMIKVVQAFYIKYLVNSFLAIMSLIHRYMKLPDLGRIWKQVRG